MLSILQMATDANSMAVLYESWKEKFFVFFYLRWGLATGIGSLGVLTIIACGYLTVAYEQRFAIPGIIGMVASGAMLTFFRFPCRRFMDRWDEIMDYDKHRW